MNGTIVDIAGISVQVIPIDLQDSTDQAHIITIKDNEREIKLEIIYGKITQITNEPIRSS